MTFKSGSGNSAGVFSAVDQARSGIFSRKWGGSTWKLSCLNGDALFAQSPIIISVIASACVIVCIRIITLILSNTLQILYAYY